MKINLKKLSIIFLSVIFLTTAGFCLALEAKYPDILGNSLPTDPTLPDYTSYFINIGISMSGILAGLIITIGGVIYIVNGALGKSKSTALDWIKSGILGLFILTCAYIILSTINPALVTPKMGDLLNIIPFIGKNISSLGGPEKIYYKEIPMGTLTETVLSRTISCYDYNDMGDPILNQVKTDDGQTVDGPTFLNRDRVDCLLKLNQAIEKKSKIIKDLSQKIADLMENCNCSNTAGNNKSCTTVGNEQCPNLDPLQTADTENCPNVNCGPGLKCECDGGNPNVCELEDNKFKLCPEGTKQKVKQGPININNNFDTKQCFSLFPFNKTNNWVWNAQTWKMQDLIDCMNVSSKKGKDYKGLLEFDDDNQSVQNIIEFVESYKKVNKKDITIISKQNWDNLRLVQQLMYLREKLNQMATTLSQDSKNLDSAKDELNKCYLAKPYVDYLKTVEQADKKQQVIMVQKNYDSYRQTFTDISKYCDGFGYTNSSCYYKCDNACPVDSQEALDCNNSCKTQDCDTICNDNSQRCKTQKLNCLQAEKNCLVEKDCFGKRPCPDSATGDFRDFNGCMASCQNQCKDDCKIKYSSCKVENTCSSCADSITNPSDLDARCRGMCPNQALDPFNFRPCYDNCIRTYPSNFPDSFCNTLLNSSCSMQNSNSSSACQELQKCQDSCNNNSKCILDNKDTCLYNPIALIECSANTTDPKNIKNCIDNSAYTCKYGSEQQAGYPDCLVKPYSLQNIFSSSSLYKDLADKQKCPNPFTVDTSSSCYSSKSPKAECSESCPEVTKCPSASNCPSCPCTIIYPNDLSTNTITPSASSYSSGGKKADEYRVVGGECENFKYNDDPLTFYCPQNWWNNDELKAPEPMANSYICPKQKEIPIGQTVDNTQKWAQKLLNYNSEFIQKTDELLQQLKSIDLLNKSDNYCKCGSECGNGEKTCNAPCKPQIISNANSDGSTSDSCACQNQGCQGNPCQFMLNNLLGKLVEGASCPQGSKINGPAQLYAQIKAKLDIISDFTLKGRTEVVKELTYSRKTMNDCSSESKANTVAQQTKLVSCTRVDSNFISPIAGNKTIINGKELDFSCYGKVLGDIYGSYLESSGATNYDTSNPTPSLPTPPSTDNWFCCSPRD